MAILNFCGWEAGDAVEAISATGTYAVQATIKRSGDYAYRNYPTALSDSHHAFTQHAADGGFGALASPWYATAHIYVATLPSANGSTVFRCGTGVAYAVEVHLDTNGNIYLYNATAPSAVAATLLTGTWYRIDITVVQNGTCRLQVDKGAEVTLAGADAAPSYFYCGTRTVSVTYDVYYDDICIDDAALPEAGRVFRLDANGNGTYTAWTGVYTDVDDIPHDSDTTYLSNAVNLDAETVTLESGAAAGLVGTPKSVKSCAVVRDEGGASAIQVRLRSATTDDDTANNDPGATYMLRAKIYNTDPATGAAWLAAALDSLEVGVENNAAVAVRCTAAFVIVWAVAAPSGSRVRVSMVIG